MNENFIPKDAINFKFPEIPSSPQMPDIPKPYKLPETMDEKEYRQTIDQQISRWDHVEDLSQGEMLEVFRDDGMVLIHAAKRPTALESGLLTASGVRHERGEPQFYSDHDKIFFSLNQIHRSEQRKTLYLFHPGIVFTRFLHTGIKDYINDANSDVKVGNPNESESSQHDLPLDYGIVLLPKSTRKESENLFERQGHFPRFVYYYDGEDSEQGLAQWREENKIPMPNSKRFREVYFSTFDDKYVENQQESELVDDLDQLGHKIAGKRTKIGMNGFIAIKKELDS